MGGAGPSMEGRLTRSPVMRRASPRIKSLVLKRTLRPLHSPGRCARTAALAFAFAVFFVFVNRSSAAGGDIDPAFNAGGAGPNGSVSAVAVQPDGKIIIVGNFSSYNGDAAASDNVMRLKADGTRDPTFNASGLGANGGVFAVAVQPDGKNVIGGVFISFNRDAQGPD